MFSSGRSSITLDDILCKTTEADILNYYLGIDTIPTVICSPLREDKRASFGLYSTDGNCIRFIDFSTKERGGLYSLLSQLWGYSYAQVLDKISQDLPKFSGHTKLGISQLKLHTLESHNNSTILQCKIRDWEPHDIEYWKSYGIPVKWLKYAEVYPISHKIIIKNETKYVFKADKYAYAYVERKEGNITLKIYQPYNKNGFKWCSKHDGSVVSLWTKIPEYGEKLVVCSSLKDALCLWCNTGIPAIATQGEGYNMSQTAISELKRRYKEIYVCFDCDEAGLIDGVKFSQSTGFKNAVLPKEWGEKDISDYYKSLIDKKQFQQIKNLFK